MKTHLNLEEVASQLGVDASEIEACIESGALPALEVGGRYLIHEQDFQRWSGPASKPRKSPILLAILLFSLVGGVSTTIAFELGQNESARVTNDIPRVLPFEGSYTLDGQPVDTTTPMLFRLYKQEVEGAAEWTSSDRMVSVTDGRFAVALGDANDSTPIPEDLFAATSLYLEVVAEGNALSPRQRIAPAPQAVTAARAASDFDVPGNLSVSGFLRRKDAGGGTQLLGTYCGSTSPTNGRVTYPIGSTDPNAPVGLPAAQRLCEDTCGSPTAHMCTSHEMTLSGQFGLYNAQSTPSWIGTMDWAYYTVDQSSFSVRDCAAMQSDDVNGLGIIVEPTPGGPYTQRQTCDVATPIACCD